MCRWFSEIEHVLTHLHIVQPCRLDSFPLRGTEAGEVFLLNSVPVFIDDVVSRSCSSCDFLQV